MPSVVAAVVCYWGLTMPALWADELATWGAVRLSWSQLWQLTGNVDLVLRPYYALMKIWTAIAGTSAEALRLPSLLGIVAGTAVVTALGKRVGGIRGALAAGLLFVAMPTVQRFAQEARPYGLVMFLGALATLCLLRLEKRPSIGRAAAYAGAGALAGLLHPLSGLLVLAGHATAVAYWQWRTRKQGLSFVLTWTPTAVVAAIPALALMALAHKQAAQVSWLAPIGQNVLKHLGDQLFLSGAVAGLLTVLAFLSVRRESTPILLAGAAFSPLILLLLAGAVLPVYTTRYVMICLPAIAVLAAATLSRYSRAHVAAAVALTAFFAWPGALSIRQPAGHGEDSAAIASIITPRYQLGDVAVFPDTHPSIPWAARDIYERYLPTPRPPDVLATTPQRTNGHFLATECPAASCLGAPPRIWIIRTDTGSPYQGMSAAKAAAISKNYTVSAHSQRAELAVYLLIRKLAVH